MVLIVIFIVFFGIGMYLMSARSTVYTTKADAGYNTTETMMEPENEMELSTEDGRTDYNVGETISILVKGDSSGNDTSGYDVLMNYNQDMTELVEVQSHRSDFQVFSYKHPTYISITGVKTLEAQGQNILHEDPLISVRFKALKSGPLNVQLIEQYGKERSQMVDSQGKVHAMDAENVLSLTIH